MKGTGKFKLVTDREEQLEHLRALGMDVDETQFNQWVGSVGYHRLSSYWYVARESEEGKAETDGKPRQFRNKTRFEDVVALYEADRKLRTLIHDGMERVEVALRAQLIEQLCLRAERDPLVYLDASTFREKFNHLEWIATIFRRLSRAKQRSESIRHYSVAYSGRYPLWVVAEAMDFTDASTLYSGLNLADQMAIAERIGIFFDWAALSSNQKRKMEKRHHLAAWLEQLTVLRNTCAHHGRVWNNAFPPAPTSVFRNYIPLPNLPECQSVKIFGSLVVMSQILNTVSPGTSWPQKVCGLLLDDFLANPLVKRSQLGIPRTWDEQGL